MQSLTSQLHVLVQAVLLILPRRRLVPPTPCCLQEIVREQQPCAQQAKAFSECMLFHEGTLDMCQEYFDKMRSCRLALQ